MTNFVNEQICKWIKILVVVLFPFALNAESLRTVPPECAQTAGDLLVEYNGRICPLQTLARDFTAALYGRHAYRGYSAEQVLLGWLLFFDDWNRHSVLFSHDRDEQLAQLRIIATLHSGHLVRLFPCRDSAGAVRWYCRGDTLPQHLPSEERQFIHSFEAYLQHLANQQDWKSLNETLNRTIFYQQQRATTVLPSPFQNKAEKLYNHIVPKMFLAISIIGISCLLLLLLLLQNLHKAVLSLFVKRTGIVTATLISSYYLLIFVLHWVVTGQLPLNNSFDTLVFLSLCSTVVALLLSKRHQRAIPFGLLISGFAMLVAVLTQKTPTITLRSSALDSPLLSIHVSIIMISYTLFAFISLNAIAALCWHCLNNDAHCETSLRLLKESQRLLYPALTLIVAGIIIGSVWAKDAWGSYWSWDPKETWALVTAILYAILLWMGTKKGRDIHPDRYHIVALVCFIAVLFTYFGVNYLLGGLHSYAN